MREGLPSELLLCRSVFRDQLLTLQDNAMMLEGSNRESFYSEIYTQLLYAMHERMPSGLAPHYTYDLPLAKPSGLPQAEVMISQLRSQQDVLLSYGPSLNPKPSLAQLIQDRFTIVSRRKSKNHSHTP